MKRRINDWSPRIVEGTGAGLLIAAIAALTDPWIAIGLIGAGLVLVAALLD